MALSSHQPVLKWRRLLHRATASMVFACLSAFALAEDLPVLPAGEHANWQAIGRINAAGFSRREMCSGTLVAPDQVLTAAHCLSGTTGIGPHPQAFTFVAGWFQGSAADSIAGASTWIHPKAYATGSLDIRYDIALLTLERPATVSPLQMANAEPVAPFAIIGYSTRRPHMLSAGFDCDGAPVSGLLRLDCPVVPGNSGGPVLNRTDAGWSVVAVVSAMTEGGALSVPVSRLTGR